MKVKSWLVAGAMMLAAVAQAQEMSDEAIKERIKPVGSVNIGGDDAQAAASGGGGGGTRSGEAVYNNACVACHGAGVLGAPKHQVAADWQPRLDERGFDMLLQNAINGYNAMPPRGTCSDCSDDEIKAAIEYMMEGV